MRHFHILIALLVGFINPAAAQENKYSIDGKHRDWTSVSTLDTTLV